ncbi:MAG TPA: hypothetical protein ENG80_01420 [Nitrospirae bacterium]|nr:hypothetical protein [Nitrospirota bacterium]
MPNLSITGILSAESLMNIRAGDLLPTNMSFQPGSSTSLFIKSTILPVVK